MRYASTILYVDDVIAIVEFYEQAFGFERAFVAPDSSYATLANDGGTLAFAGRDGAPAGVARANEQPAGFEIWIESDDVPALFLRAVEAGATAIAEPITKPWGQMVAYVTDPNGTLVEIGAPVGD
jgi:lactoylglutathione lyase